MAQEFYAAFVKNSYHVEGDERSKTNPGHGYGAHTVTYKEVIEFKDRDEMLKWVQNRHNRNYDKNSYRIVLCTPLEVQITVDVQVTANLATRAEGAPCTK